MPPDVRFLRLKCTKFDFRWRSAPDPAGGAYSAPQDSLSVFNGRTSKGKAEKKGRGKRRGGKGRGKGKRKKVEGWGWDVRGGEGPGPQIFWPKTAPADAASPSHTKICILFISIYNEPAHVPLKNVLSRGDLTPIAKVTTYNTLSKRRRGYCKSVSASKPRI